MKLTNKDRLEMLKGLEEKLDRVDEFVSYTGVQYLAQAKQYVCALKTSIYVEEQMNEDQISE